MTVTEPRFWNYTAKSRSDVVHVAVSYIIIFIWYTGFHAYVKWKLKFETNADCFFYFEKLHIISRCLMTATLVYAIKKKNNISYTHILYLKLLKTVCFLFFFPLFFRFSSSVGGQQRHFRLLFGIWP